MHPWNTPLFEALKARLERFPHALLIHGVRGTGKLALAERVAQLLLCEDPAHRPCGRCDGCRWLAAGSHPDFRRIEPEALAKEPLIDPEEAAETPAKRGKPSIDIKIEQVRDLAGFLNLRSHRGRLRVALVHPAEAMNRERGQRAPQGAGGAARRRGLRPRFAPALSAPAHHSKPVRGARRADSGSRAGASVAGGAGR